MNRSNVTNGFVLFCVTLTVGILGATLTMMADTSSASSEKTTHSGHEHAEEASEEQGEHAGHGHAEEAAADDGEHAGHNHTEAESDQHAGHDHAEAEKHEPGEEGACDCCEPGESGGHEHAEAESDAHAGHNHGEEAVADDGEHAGHNHAEEAATDDGEHAGHNHGEEAVADGGEHAGHNHGEEAAADDGEHAGHNHAEDAGAAASPPEDIEFATAGAGELSIQLAFPGEVTYNQDRLAHIVPRMPGIVTKVYKTVGDRVRAGEVMAVIESTEVGKEKVEYLAKKAEVGCCTILVSRAQAIHDNTLKLVEHLKTLPTLTELHDFKVDPLGENRATLISAYAEVVFARAAYEREQGLKKQRISSENDFLAAENAFKKAEAIYMTAIDSACFKVSQDLLEAKRERQVLEADLKNAERTLLVLGISQHDIDALDILVSTHPADNATQAVKAVKAAKECTDPNCTDCKKEPVAKHECADPNCTDCKDEPVAKHECTDPNCTDCEDGHSEHAETGHGDPVHAEDSLACYPLRAPFDGTIIAKHITLGERLGEDANAFTVADLDTVWVDFKIFQKSLGSVSTGQDATVLLGERSASARGRIDYIAPVLGQETRAALGRIVLPNPNRDRRPGQFVTVHVTSDRRQVPVLVPKDAIQVLDNESVVFVEDSHGLEPRPVVLGRSDATHAEVLSGLSGGERIVTGGAFLLKAQIVTSGMDPHAGHGH